MQTAVTTVANTAVLVRKGELGASDVVTSVLLCVLYLCRVFSGKRILGQYSEIKDIFFLFAFPGYARCLLVP